MRGWGVALLGSVLAALTSALAAGGSLPARAAEPALVVVAERPASELRLTAGRRAGAGWLALDDAAGLHARVRETPSGLRLETHPALPAQALELARALRPWVVAAVSEGKALRLTLADGVQHALRREGGTRLLLEFRSRPPPRPTQRRRSPEPLAAIAPAAGPAPAAVPTPEPRGPGVELRWRNPVPAAILVRAGVLWAVFGGSRAELLQRDVLAGSPAALQELPAVEGPGLLALRFVAPSSAAVHAERSGPVWSLRLAPHGSRAGAPAAIRAVDGRLELDAHGRLASIDDPLSGDRLHLLLSDRPELAGPEARTFVDLEMLPTITGLAWRALADGTEARLDQGRLVLSRPGGLRLAASAPAAAPPAAELARETQAEAPAEQAALQLAASGAGGDPAARRHQLQARLALARGRDQAPLRLELARLLLADGLGAEALAVLDAGMERGAAAARPATAADARLRAAAALLQGRPRRALELLGEAAGDEETALWQAAARADLRDWPAAAEALARAGSVWSTYRPALRMALGLRAAEIWARTGRTDAALTVLDRLGELPLKSRSRARLALVRGLALAQAPRHHRGAAAALAAAARDGDPATRVWARFLATQAAREHGGLSGPEALGRLAEQRSLWRGHPNEAEMLAGLAGLQQAEGDPGAALMSWAAALSRHPPPALAARIKVEAERALSAALQGEGTDPITALALYRAHRGLLAAADPSATAALAARLAEAGLPGVAARLLEPVIAASPGRAAELARYRREAQLAGAASAPAGGAGPAALAGLALAAAPLAGPVEQVLAALDRDLEALRTGLPLPASPAPPAL